MVVSVVPSPGMKEVESNCPSAECVHANHDDLQMVRPDDGEGDVHHDDAHEEEGGDTNFSKLPLFVLPNTAAKRLPGLLI